MTLQPPSATSLDRLIRPRSVAIVGASPTPGALGASVLANLERMGFTGDIHLINPKRDEIGGRACLESIDALPQGIDVAVLAIPRAGVLDAVRALAAKGVGAAVIFSAGFAEARGEGVAEQLEVAQIAAEAGMVIEGPNCLGLVNFVDRTPLTFVEMPDAPLGDRPGIAIVSQSGAMAAVLGVSLLSRGLGLSYSISTGNEAASGVEDYVEWLIDDPRTQVIAMVVEQFRMPRRFLAAAQRARGVGKTIVLLHPGKSSAARASAATHTGAMAGDYQVMRVHVARAGVVVAETLEELGDIAEIARRCPPMPKGGVVVLGESGAFKAMVLDHAEELGLDLPSVTGADAPSLRAAMPDFVDVSNPLDVTAQGLVDPGLYTRTIGALLADERFGVVLIGIIQTDPGTCHIKLPAILDAFPAEGVPKPVIVAGLDEGAPGADSYVEGLRGRGACYFPTAERVLRALARLQAARDRDVRATDAPPERLPALSGVHGVVPEFRAKALLGPVGIAFPAGELVRTCAEAQAAAERLGYPVVLKAQSAELSHKSDAGGVVLGLRDADTLAQGWARLARNIAAARPGLVLDGVLVEAMGEPGVELIVGARNDPDWGPVILAGFGGVEAELVPDIRLLAIDLTLEGIAAELRKLKRAALFAGFRGGAPLDLGAAAALIFRLGRLLAGEPKIREIDLNPVIILPEGRGIVALDALMLMAGKP